MNGEAIALPSDKIADFCRRHHIRSLRLFGSALRGKLKSDSDLDVLVEFDPDHVPGFFGLARMEEELSELVGRRVDLNTPMSLGVGFREQVLREAQVHYGPTPGSR